MSRIHQWSICVIALGALLVSESLAAPPPGRGSRGGSSSGFGFSIGGPSGIGFQSNFGNTPHQNYNHYNGGNYYDRGFYGGSGVYLGGGSRDFRWGVGIPFGYDDYDWYSPYYNYYRRNYYLNEPGYSSSDYYYGDNNAANVQQQPNEPPPVPTAGQVARLTDEQLRMMVAMALDNYSRELDGFTTGAGWKKHFKLAELKTIVTSSDGGQMDSSERAIIGDITQKMIDAAKDQSYEVITSPWGFKTLSVALKELSLPVMQRQAHMLLAKSQSLKRSLDNISTGAGWKTYLKIDELDDLLAQNPSSTEELNTKLEKILERFDEVSKNPDYKAVAEIQGFDVTRAGLQKYINALPARTSKDNVPPPPGSANL